MVASPCINVCEMESPAGVCRGCFRTLDEIAGWAGATDDAKRQILVDAAKRREGRSFSSDGKQRER